MGKLFSCPTCRNRISVNAESCPQCGERRFHEYGYVDRAGRMTESKSDAAVTRTTIPCVSCKGVGHIKTEEEVSFLGLFDYTETTKNRCSSCNGHGYITQKTVKRCILDHRTNEARVAFSESAD